MAWSFRIAAVAIGLSCGPAGAVPFTGSERAIVRTLARDAREGGERPSDRSPTGRASIRLGRDLFFDPRLAGNNAWSCATCHQPARGWTDGESTPSRFPKVNRNTQSVWDVRFERSFFWDGRVRKLRRQALEPLESAKEMNGHRVKTALLIRQDPHLRADYSTAFGPFSEAALQEVEERVATPSPASASSLWDRVYRSLSARSRAAVDGIFANVGRALAAFQRRLTSGVSRFDHFATELLARGRSDTLSPQELRGLKLFIGEARCVTCHSKQTFSDGRLHVVADRNAKLDTRGPPKTTAASNPAGHQSVKTPRLRNIALTAPYMHDGSLTSLEDVLQSISADMTHRIGRPSGLCEEDQASIVAFLRTLTDERYSKRDPGGLYVLDDTRR